MGDMATAGLVDTEVATAADMEEVGVEVAMEDTVEDTVGDTVEVSEAVTVVDTEAVSEVDLVEAEADTTLVVTIITLAPAVMEIVYRLILVAGKQIMLKNTKFVNF